MRFIFAIVALCLVTVNADVDESFASSRARVDEALAEVAQYSNKSALEYKIEEVVRRRSRLIDDALKVYQQLREINDACMAAEYDKVNLIVDAMQKIMINCRVLAAKTVVEIMANITDSRRHIESDAKSLLRGYKGCFKQGILNGIKCLQVTNVGSELFFKDVDYFKLSTNKRMHDVMIDADACSHKAAEEADSKLSDLFPQFIREAMRCISE